MRLPGCEREPRSGRPPRRRSLKTPASVGEQRTQKSSTTISAARPRVAVKRGDARSALDWRSSPWARNMDGGRFVPRFRPTVRSLDIDQPAMALDAEATARRILASAKLPPTVLPATRHDQRPTTLARCAGTAITGWPFIEEFPCSTHLHTSTPIHPRSHRCCSAILPRNPRQVMYPMRICAAPVRSASPPRRSPRPRDAADRP